METNYIKIRSEQIAKFFRSHPYIPISPSNNEFWHQHICLPLHLGEECFEFCCPHSDDRGFDWGNEDECENCPYFKYVDINYLRGDSQNCNTSALKMLDDYFKEQENEQ